MTLHDPILRFLGVRHGSDPRTLLGLNRGHVQAPQIEAALRERLASVLQHPDSRSPDAELVRKVLRESAEHLKREVAESNLATAVTVPEPVSVAPFLSKASKSSPPRQPASASPTPTDGTPSWLTPRRPSREPMLFHLTAFDRLVLAVLVASGGWNANSRARLVALAAAHGLTVQGLIRVVQGLSHYASSGGARLDVNEITAGESLSNYMPPAPTGPPVGAALLDMLTENFSAELKREDPWTTIKLALIFGALTIGALILAVRIALYPSLPPPAEPPSVATSPFVATTSVSSGGSTHSAARQATTPRRIAAYPKIPTFLGNALPGESIKAVEQFRDIPARLDEIARKITVEEQPSEAVFRHWEADIDTIAIGWQLADSSSRKQIEAKLVEVLRAAGDRPSVSDRLLNSFIAPPTVAAPLDIWRGAWKTQTSWKIAAASDLVPPVVRQRALALLENAMPNTERHRTSEDAAAAWLDLLVPQLVTMIELNDQTYDYWELWLAAQRGLGKGERHDASITRALHAVLATDTDLGRAGRTVNVAARLLHVAVESSSVRIKSDLQAIFDDEKISSRDLWVLTSLLSMNDEATWFPDGMVLPDDADMMHRWRIRDEFDRIWPTEASLAEGENAHGVSSGRPLAVDPSHVESWSGVVDTVLAQPPLALPEELLRQLIQASALIEAAEALVVQDHTEYVSIMMEMASDTDPRTIKVPRRPAGRVGQQMTPDGSWSHTYQQAGKSPEQRIEAIRTLRTTNAGDLGPSDADLLVREAYRGSPAEVRAAAQEMVVKFINGPNIAQAMLDQFGDAPVTDSLAKLIADVTSQPVPSVRVAGWAVAAKVALLEHALELRPQSESGIDALASTLADSYATRLSLIRRERMKQSAARQPHHVAGALVQAWHEQAEPLRVANPLPDTLSNLQRRRAMRSRLVDGPMHQFSAHQLALLDLVAYIAVAEQPAKRETVAAILRDSADARNASSTVLEQALHTERAMVRIWRVRLGLDESNAEGADGTRANAAFTAVSPSIFPPSDMRHPMLEPWLPRLELLSPNNPAEYFELAEEIADAHGQSPGRDLARWLFAVSGAIDPSRLGRSACLALADLETDAKHKQRLLALASLMGGGMLGPRNADSRQTAPMPTWNNASGSASMLAAALAMSDGLGHYRRGEGPKALAAFRKPGATELLTKFDRHLAPNGGAERILDDCKHFRGNATPILPPEQIVAMMNVELALLSGTDRTWASDLLLYNAQPLMEVDPDRLVDTLGVDARRILFRNGRWTDR